MKIKPLLVALVNIVLLIIGYLLLVQIEKSPVMHGQALTGGALVAGALVVLVIGGGHV